MSFPERGEILFVYQRHIREFSPHVFGSAEGDVAQFFGGHAAVPYRGESGVKLLCESRRPCGAGVIAEFCRVAFYHLGEEQDGTLRREALLYARADRLFRKAGEGGHAHVEHGIQPESGDDPALGRGGEFVGHDDDVFPAVAEPFFELAEDAVIGVVSGVGKNDLHASSISRPVPLFKMRQRSDAISAFWANPLRRARISVIITLL